MRRVLTTTTTDEILSDEPSAYASTPTGPDDSRLTALLVLQDAARQELAYVMDQGGHEGGQTLVQEAAGNLASILLELSDDELELECIYTIAEAIVLSVMDQS